MGAGDLLKRGMAALRGVVRPTPDDNGRMVGDQPAAVPSDLGPLTVENVRTIRRILHAHDEGDLLESGLLAVSLLRDADVVGALGQRLLALQACPTTVHPTDDSDAAKAAAVDLSGRWGRIVSRAAMGDLVGGAIFLGASLGQLVWYPDESTGELEPRLEPWPWHALEWRSWERRWYAHTTHGAVPVTPGDGQWVLFAPRSEMQPLAWGVVRSIAVWATRAEFGASDLSHHVEAKAPAWVATVPLESRKTEDAKSFIRGLRNLGRNAVIPTPRGPTQGESYDVRIEEAKAEASKVFELLLRIAGGKVRLAILGQDLTSQNNQVGTNASSQSGEGVTDLVVTADGLGWDECMTAQVALPWARYRGTPPCRIVTDTERETDAKADAEASKAEAEAVAAWAKAGVEVDAVAHATAAGMKGARRRAAPSPAADSDTADKGSTP